MRYDLVLTGGDVIDVGGGQVGRLDVAVTGGRIAAVTPAIPHHEADEVVDVSGRLVTPGLVDLHTHVHPGATYWGIDPDAIAWCSGVTTWVDAGSAGAYTLDSLRRAVRGFQVRVPALLNVSAVGLTGRAGESHDLDDCDVDLAIATVTANRDLVAGLKVRMDSATGGRHGLEPLRRAVRIADACGVPVMVHIGTAPPDVPDVLSLLRPGDLVTHCASGLATGLVGAHGVETAVKEAYAAGVHFDIGHGSGGFAFDVLEAQLAAGIIPYTVSTDLHARSQYGPAFDLPTTMAKMLAVGLSLKQVVAATTVHPARALRLTHAGTLAIGAPADIAVFSVREGSFEVTDVHRQRRRSPRLLVNEATYVGGRALPPKLPEPPPPWVPLTDGQRAALRRRARLLRDMFTTPLVDADGLAEQFPRKAGHGGR